MSKVYEYYLEQSARDIEYNEYLEDIFLSKEGETLELKKQILKLREALAHYAVPSEGNIDAGRIAREALKGGSE